MKTILRISLILNLVLLGSLVFILANQRKEETAPVPVSSEAKPSAPAVVTPSPAASPGVESKPFQWRQLESTKDYRVYVANLRAIGCPEPTIEDIVRGDAARAFSWERRQLGLDGSGAGPWSRSREMQLVASLLGGQVPTVATLTQNTGNPTEANSGEVAQTPVTSQSTATDASSDPLFLQKNVNWSALGFTAEQQAAIMQVRQRFLSAVGNLSQNSNGSAGQNPDSTNPDVSPATANPNDSASLSQWQRASQNADDELRGLLGAQGWLAYEQQQYDYWYKAQVAAANGGHLTLNLATFSLK